VILFRELSSPFARRYHFADAISSHITDHAPTSPSARCNAGSENHPATAAVPDIPGRLPLSRNSAWHPHDFDVSRTTIDKVLRAMDVKPLSRPRRHRKGSTRYARLIPSERIQMDTCKIAPAVYQYTAIDDGTRIRVLAVYPRRTAANSLLFLERMNEEMPFPVQAIQTDRGREFFAYCFQEKLMQYAIKFRPIRPASPHLNGKVERSQHTDLDEFYPTVDPKSPDLQQRLLEWQDHYNQYRPHGSLNGRTPWEAWLERVALAPFHDDVEASYDDSTERIRHPDYQMDLRLAAKNKRKPAC
jgi:transposase InsO family protein